MSSDMILALFFASFVGAASLPQQPLLNRSGPRALLAARHHACGQGPVPHYPEIGEEHARSCGSASSSCKPADPLDVTDESLNELDSGFVSGSMNLEEIYAGVRLIADQLDQDELAREAYANSVVVPLHPVYGLLRSDISTRLLDSEVDAWQALESFSARPLCPSLGPLCSCPLLLCEEGQISTVLLTRIKARAPLSSLLPLARFQKMRSLTIGQNVFSPRMWQSLAKARLPQLKTLSLFAVKHNRAHLGELPRMAPNLEFLQVRVMYNMNHPQESEALPPEVLEPICQLSGLKVLSIFGPFTALPDCLGNLTSLLKIDVRGCWLRLGLPSSFGKLTQLRSFVAFGQREHHCPEADCVSSWDNRISNEDSPVFWCPAGGWAVPLSSVMIPEWRSMEKFWVDQNFLTGPLPSWIPKRWPRLRSLDLYSNRLTGGVPEDLLGLPNLVQLQLHDNLLSGVVPHTQAFSPSLKFIDVSLNPELHGCWPLVEPTSSSDTVALAALSGLERSSACGVLAKAERHAVKLHAVVDADGELKSSEDREPKTLLRRED